MPATQRERETERQREERTKGGVPAGFCQAPDVLLPTCMTTQENTLLSRMAVTHAAVGPVRWDMSADVTGSMLKPAANEIKV